MSKLKYLFILVLMVSGDVFARDRTEPERLNVTSMWVWVDPINGCEYLVRQGSDSSPTPRLNPNGTQICRPNGRIVETVPACR